MSSQLEVGYRGVNGLEIRYADSGGAASQRLVLTSPWPQSLYAFDRIWPRLSGIARLLAVDLPGFGRSQAHTELLSPTAMSEFVIQILDEWAIAEPHLICPGIGTPAALFAAARHPGRIRSMIIGGGPAEQLPLLAGLLPHIFTPVQIITGRHDPHVPAAGAAFLHARLPNSRLDVLDTGDLPWEETPGQYAAIIAAWINGGYLTGTLTI